MGTTLTGTTPQDTYDSLIKVTDNGPLSGTAKYLSDGLGNDSVLALSTSRVGIGTASPNQKLHINGGNVTIDDSSDVFLSFAKSGVSKYELYLDNASNNFGLYDRGATSWRLFVSNAGNVGIGTSSPSTKLHVKGAINIERDSTTDFSTIDNDGNLNIKAATGGAGGSYNITFRTGGVERMRVTANGLTFNGDTAAANALDDYEEGTFTATLKGSVSDPTTPVTTTGTYTKIGRQVTVNVIFSNVNTTGASGDVSITGMPFTASGTSNGAVNCYQFTFPSNTSVASYLGLGSTSVEILVSGTNANWAALGHSAGSSRYLWTTITYFV